MQFFVNVNSPRTWLNFDLGLIDSSQGERNIQFGAEVLLLTKNEPVFLGSAAAKSASNFYQRKKNEVRNESRTNRAGQHGVGHRREPSQGRPRGHGLHP